MSLQQSRSKLPQETQDITLTNTLPQPTPTYFDSRPVLDPQHLLVCLYVPELKNEARVSIVLASYPSHLAVQQQGVYQEFMSD